MDWDRFDAEQGGEAEAAEQGAVASRVARSGSVTVCERVSVSI